MLIEKLQRHYNNKIEAWHKNPAPGTAQPPEKTKDTETSASRYDIEDLMDDLRKEYYGKVLPLLNDNQGQLRKCSVPVTKEALKTLKAAEGEQQDQIYSAYLSFRLAQLIHSITTNDKEISPFSLF
ncbi:MAG: hypothetical protein ACOY46_20660 [Bacillota bacterium]